MHVQSNKPKGKELCEDFVRALPDARLKPEDVQVLVSHFNYNSATQVNTILFIMCLGSLVEFASGSIMVPLLRIYILTYLCCLQVVTFDYGMKTDDPIKKVLFYKKNKPNKACKMPKVLEILHYKVGFHRVLFI